MSLGQTQQGHSGLPLCKVRRKPGFVPGTNPLCPGDKPGLSPGHSRGVPRATGPKSLCLCAFFLPDSRCCLESPFASKVPEGHHPRGTTLREALRGNLPLRGLCGGPAGVSPRVLRGSAGFCGGPRDIPRFFGGSDPMLVTLRNCWIRGSQRSESPSVRSDLKIARFESQGQKPFESLLRLYCFLFLF